MTTQIRVADTVVRDITDWLLAEAELLDGRRHREWFKLMAEDLRYTVPLRVTREGAADNGVIPDMCHMDDDRNSMEMRVLRLETEYAWAEDPPSRSRHFVTNIRVRPGDDSREFQVSSNLLLYRTRGDNPTFDLLSGERKDVLRRVDDGYQLVRRIVLLDQTTIMTHSLSLVM